MTAFEDNHDHLIESFKGINDHGIPAWIFKCRKCGLEDTQRHRIEQELCTSSQVLTVPFPPQVEGVLPLQEEEGVSIYDLTDPSVYVAERDGSLQFDLTRDETGQIKLLDDSKDEELESGEVTQHNWVLDDVGDLEFIDESDIPPPADPASATHADYERQKVVWRAYCNTALESIFEACKDLGKAKQQCSLHPHRHDDLSVVYSKLREAELMLQGIIRRPHEDDDKK